MLKKASLCAIVFALSCVSVYAQFWPVPDYTTPDSPKACAQCPGSDAGLLTVGWHDPVQKFVGRFESSEYVSSWIYGTCGGVRTLRASGNIFNPDKSRLIVRLGNAIGSYDTAAFLSRLENHEALAAVSTFPVRPTTGARCGDPLEQYLSFERFFNAEGTSDNWRITPADGQDRLYAVDVDDRGYVYMAYGLFGFGIATDSGSSALMPSYQHPPSLTWSPTRVFWVRDGAKYYAYVEHGLDKSTHVVDVTGGLTNITEMAPFPKGIVEMVRGGNGRVAFFDETQTTLYIYDNHNLVVQGTPVAAIPFGTSPISHLQWDGTYWWATSTNSDQIASLSRFNADGSGRFDFPLSTTFFSPLSFRIRDGYAVMVTGEPTGRGLRLYRISTGTPVEIPVPSLSKYYVNSGGTGYASTPPHMQLWGADPVVSNGKLYLLVSADGLGDVWQIRTDDGVSIAVQGTKGPQNPNTPTRTAGDIFYGDFVNFSATLSSGVAGGNVSFNFGAPKDPANTQSSTFGSTITHQYSGLTAADIVAPLTVTATNPSNGSSGSTAITLKKPTARISYGSAASKTLITLPGTGTPLLLDDSFFDASDGDSAGHYTDWRIAADAASTANTAPNYQPPTAAVSAGTCGQHTLLMTAHYGYASYAAANVDFPVSPAPANGSSMFTYNVQAFATGVDRASSAASVDFFSTSRAAAALSGRTWSYVWDLVDTAANNAVVSAITPLRGTATSLAALPHFTVAKTNFTAGTRYAARLTLSVDGVDPCVPTGQASAAAQTAVSLPVVGPDATGIQQNCVNGNCTFSVSSPSNVMVSDGWTFAWTTPNGTPTTGNASTQPVMYTSAGTFNVSVVITNKAGLSVTLTDTVRVTTPASLCPAMVGNANIFATYEGVLTGSTCRDGFGTCAVNEPIAFKVDWLVYPDINCKARATVSWRFDGGTAIAADDATSPVGFTFASASQHTAECTVTIDNKSVVLTKSLTIVNASTGGGPTGGGPTGGGPTNPVCGTMTSLNTEVRYFGPVSGCHTGGACNTGENLQFSVGFLGYDSTCASHTYTWSVDNSAGQIGGASLFHAFPTTGTHTVTCSISNGTQTYVARASVVINEPASPTPTCPTLQFGRNVSLDYTGSAGCHFGTNCAPGEAVTFTLSYYQYDPSCGPHTYVWKVDGATIGTGATATTSALTNGPHNVVCTVSNGGAPVDVIGTVTIAASVPATPAFTFDFLMAQLPTSVGAPPNTWVFNVSSIVPDTVTAASQKWVWNFGDGSPEITAGAAYTHTFPDDKQYTITLKAVGNSYIKTHTTPEPVARRRSVRH